MKNESRIEELLAESLRNQDKQAELLKKHSISIEQMSEAIGQQSGKLDQVVLAIREMSKAVILMTDSLDTVIHKIDKIDDHERRIQLLERRIGK